MSDKRRSRRVLDQLKEDIIEWDRENRHRLIQEAVDAALESLQGPPRTSEQKVLAVLRPAPLRRSDIASKAGLHVSTAGRVLRALVARGVAARGKAPGTYVLNCPRRRSRGAP
jgi:CRP-like cAMP-binding protein